MNFNPIKQAANIIFPHLKGKVAELGSGELRQDYTYVQMIVYSVNMASI